MKKYLLFFFPFLSLDIFTKMFAIQHIPLLLPKQFGYPYGGIAIFETSAITFSLNTVFNSGAAWGIFQGYPGFLFAIRAMAIMGLAIYLLSVHRGETSTSRLSWHTFPLWLVTVGAIGNCIDYIVYGQVVDFFHVCFWGHTFPVFNIADCYISLGVFALLVAPRKSSLPTLQV